MTGEPAGQGDFACWIRPLPGTERVELKDLPIMADGFPPPVFDLKLPVNWVPTVELTVHARGVPAPGWLRARIRTRFVQYGLLEEEVELWDETDQLVAQSRAAGAGAAAPAGLNLRPCARSYGHLLESVSVMASKRSNPDVAAKRTWGQRVKDNLPVLFVLLGIATFRTAVADWSHIPSSSMEPNFFPGDYIWVEKFSYGPSIPLLNRRLPGWGSPERGDIVTFLPPHTEDVYIKRVIGVPGDQVVIRGAEVWVNGQLLPTRFEQQPDGDIAATQRLGDHEYSILYSARRPIRAERTALRGAAGAIFHDGRPSQ